MAKFYPTLSNRTLRRFSGAGKQEIQSELLADFGENTRASKQLNQAMLQKRGIRQRYLKEPRTQAIKRATSDAETQGFRGKSRSEYVQKNWKRFL